MENDSIATVATPANAAALGDKFVPSVAMSTHYQPVGNIACIIDDQRSSFQEIHRLETFFFFFPC